ncbi:pyridoxine 5'-phosphate synthase [Bdellovibrionota bacterium FG-2]
MQTPRLGVNIDHIATLRQLRGTPYPDLLAAARMVETAGADQITVHLREDRRHIQDQDVKILRKNLKIPLNLEMAVAPEIVRFAVKLRPEWSCLVPEKRREVTTEGGLDLQRNRQTIAAAIKSLKRAGIKVSCFIEPSIENVELSHELGADAVELHTGKFCLLTQKANDAPGKLSSAAKKELARIEKASLRARALGLGAHAGHGFDYDNVRWAAALECEDRNPLVEEFNIGHAIVCRAVLVGLERAVREMVSAIIAP